MEYYQQKKRVLVNRSILLIFLTILNVGVLNSYGQGQVSRPTKNQTQTSSPKKSAPQNKKSTPQIKISEPDGYINGHGYVDLGLPSGTKWATCNVGASKPEEYGDYYAWGETQPKHSYDTDNYFDYSEDVYKLGGKTEIGAKSGHDAARENWGGTWRMPTASKLQELNDMCKWEWTKINGHKGYSVMGPNGKSIFLPAAGIRDVADFTLFNQEGEQGSYWSSSLSLSYSSLAFGLNFNSDGHKVRDTNRRYGRSVRCVTE